jgi:hypothetical protein
MLGLARWFALGGAIALAGCVTVENSLSQNDVAGMKLTAVTVNYAPDALVRWGEGVEAYAASKGIAENQVATNTPEVQAYVRNMLGQRIKADVERAMMGQLAGSRPVRLEVVVHNFLISGVLQNIIVGSDRRMRADANLVDARTGAVIIAHPGISVSLPAAGGLVGVAVQAAIDNAAERSVTDKIVDAYALEYRQWLLRPTS